MTTSDDEGTDAEGEYEQYEYCCLLTCEWKSSISKSLLFYKYAIWNVHRKLNYYVECCRGK